MSASRRQWLAALAATLVLAHAAAVAQEKFIVLASTTSTEQSGLFGHLLPVFEKKTGIKVRVVAVGSGQALDLGRRGDADVVLVHDRPAEEKFVAAGFAVRRLGVMGNDFVLIGPQADPARAAGQDIVEGLTRVATARAAFVSRADNSGTHAAEVGYWRLAGLDIARLKGSWYRETGAGMGPALNTAASLDAYILADRGTWLAFRNRGRLGILVQGDKRLFNQYGVMLVDPAKHRHVKADLGQAFIDFLTSVEGQQSIASFRIGGEQAFFPNFKP